jgi:hypothetical protein
MKDRLQMGRFRLDRVPKTLTELSTFAEWALENILSDSSASGGVVFANFVFGPAYDGGIDVFRPQLNEPEYHAIWSERLSCLLQQMRADSTIAIDNCYLWQGRVYINHDPPSPRAMPAAYVKIVTAHGDCALFLYPIVGTTPKIQFGEPIYHAGFEGVYSDVFTRTQHDASAKAYARQMLARFPPDHPAALQPIAH